jgi:probable HAF family extracellular repeat protein
MQTFLLGHRRQAAALRTIVVTLATLAAATACRPDDPLPTAPRCDSPVAPRATVVGASVIGLPTLGGTGQSLGYDINDAGQVVGWPTRPATLPSTHSSGPGSRHSRPRDARRARSYACARQQRRPGRWTERHPHRVLATRSDGRRAEGMQDLGTIDGVMANSSPTTSTTPDTSWVGATWPEAPPIRSSGRRVRACKTSARLAARTRRRAIRGHQQRRAGRRTERSRHLPANRRAVPRFPFDARTGHAGPGHDRGQPQHGPLRINDAGQVVGSSYHAPGAPSPHAFLFTPGQGMQDLGTLAGANQSKAYDINAAGQVVGFSASGASVSFAPSCGPCRTGWKTFTPSRESRGDRDQQPRSSGWGQPSGDAAIPSAEPCPGGEHRRAVHRAQEEAGHLRRDRLE